MPTINLIDQVSTNNTTSSPGKTLVLDNWATLSRGVVPVQFWVYADEATIGDTGQVILLDDSDASVITVNIDDGPGWYMETGELPATTAKYDVHFGNNKNATLVIKDFSLLPLIGS